MILHVTVNGQDRRIEAPPLRRLADILRQDLGLVAAKIGCGEGECGACNVWVDGEAVSACLIPAVQVDGSRIVTLEGLAESNDAALTELLNAFVEHDASQCGACIPGIVMTVRSLFDDSRNRRPSEEELRGLLAGHLCRCTGYEAIVRATLAWLKEQPET